MQNYLFIGGGKDGLSYPAPDNAESVQLPGATGSERYIRDSLAVGAYSSITFYRLEKLTPEEVLDHLVRHYEAWAVNHPGSRQ